VTDAPGVIAIVLALADAAATDRAGRALAGLVRAGDVVGLVGDLGAGKTALVTGLVAGLGAPVAAASPTFALINVYRGGRLPVVHADLYRIERARELAELGLDEAIDRGDGVVVVEWADRFAVLPPDHVRAELAHAPDGGRSLAITGHGPRGTALAAAWRAAC
jgi:tRNA threonylcarbamoyladenosine biosynthesis protein TsaE